MQVAFRKAFRSPPILINQLTSGVYEGVGVGVGVGKGAWRPDGGSVQVLILDGMSIGFT